MNPRDISREELLQRVNISPERLIELENSEAEADQETLALLKIIALGRRQYERGEVVPAEEVFRRLRAKYGIR